MIFGKKEFRINSFFADFIFPIVSHHHQSDPIVEMIKFEDFIPNKTSDFNEFCSDIFTDETIWLLRQISTGFPIEINEEQAFKMRFISIILGNEELFLKINENFPPNFNETNLITYLRYIECCYHYSQFSRDYISSHFYSIDEYEFLKLPRKIQYSIISNSNLQIKSEDWLFSLIQQIVNKSEIECCSEKVEEIEGISFLEQIEFTSLSELKLREFLEEFDFNQMTNKLWHKLFQCFFIHFDQNFKRTINQHSIKKYSFEYDSNSRNQFEGIIHHLTEKYGGNVDTKGVCKITSSSTHNNHKASNIADFQKTAYFSSLGENNSWVMYDFVRRKVHPTFYSIQTWDLERGNSHIQNWVVEGSNTKNDDDWKLLDERKNNNDLDFRSAKATFEIDQTNLDPNEYFRYLRIRQNGRNSRNTNQLIINNLVFFGSIIQV